MIESTIALRYAKALQKIGLEQSQMDVYLEELEAVLAASKADDHLEFVLTNRQADYQARLRVVDEICKSHDMSKNTNHFLKLLIKKGRMELFPHVVKAYRRLVFNSANKVEALYITAKPLSDDEKKSIDQLMEAHSGKKVVSENEVDPEVLGGVAVKIGGEIFDGTIKYWLDQLGNQLKHASLEVS